MEEKKERKAHKLCVTGTYFDSTASSTVCHSERERERVTKDVDMNGDFLE